MNPTEDVSNRCENILCYCPSNRGGTMVMQYDKKPRLLRNIQIQSLAVESEKTEVEDLVEEVCKEVDRKWLNARYLNDHQRLWTDIMEQQRE